MTSGQWTMGAMTKVRSWVPRLSTSPSLTSRASSTLPALAGKYALSMGTVLALQTICASGQRSSTSAMVAAWSGSI